MQSVTLHSHVGSDGILQLKVPPDFTNTDLTVILKTQPVMPPVEMSPASKNKSEPTRLVNKGGILMATGELLGDVSNIVQQDRERRLAKLIGEGDL
ncbi:MAG TPA: hypothetical protein DCM38_08280 [Gammaproteobacteria bacterium]|nr:hypothetical protein [Gammaproteobacteria bacterium]